MPSAYLFGDGDGEGDFPVGLLLVADSGDAGALDEGQALGHASIIDPMDEAEKKAFSQLSTKQQQTLIETTHLFTDILTQEFMRLIKEICPDI